MKCLQGNYSCGEPPLSNCNVFTLPIVGFSAQRYYHLPPTASGLLGNTTPTVPIEFQAFILYINSSKSFPEFGGDLVSTGELRQGLHARDAVGPLKNGFYIIANDYDVAVAA